MLIAIDIGNSNIKIGLFREGHNSQVPEVRRISLKGLQASSKNWDALSLKLKELLYNLLFEKTTGEVTVGAIISSVVPELTEPCIRGLSGFTDRVLLMSYRLDTGLTFAIPDPSKTGTDRIAATAGAYNEFKCPLVVVDLGSATTLTVVGKGGLYLGGAILPGVTMMAQVLHEGTGLLPKIEPSLEGLEPIGKKTVSAINSGIIYGTAGAIERLRSEFEKELGYRLLLITTGGNAFLIEPYIKADHRRPYLVLEGLKLIFERNV
jgi:type III pantothenate kinase